MILTVYVAHHHASTVRPHVLRVRRWYPADRSGVERRQRAGDRRDGQPPSPRRRMLAIVLGGVGAVFFRLILASVATTLLQISLLRAIGGVILLFIAIRLLSARMITSARASHRKTDCCRRS